MGHGSWTHELKALRRERVNSKRRSVVHGARQRLILVLTSWRLPRERAHQQHASATLLLVHRSVLYVHSSDLKVPSRMPYDV